MLERKPVFPHVIEMNLQAGYRIGCNVYLIYDDDRWMLLDIGFDDAVDEIVELVRQMDFPLSRCEAIVATHADADHIQGLARARSILKCQAIAHKLADEPLRTADPVVTFSEIKAQNIKIDISPVELDRLVEDGDIIEIGSLKLEVWHTPGHCNNQLALRLGNLLFSGDNIFRDGCVGAIDAHHGSDIGAFIRSLERIRDSQVEWLLPSHGPIFRRDDKLINATIARLKQYLHMADFGTCAAEWPLMDEWDRELAEGKMPG